MRLLILFLSLLPACAQVHTADHVVVIGVDGMSPAGLRKARVPTIDAMRAAGSWTYHARGVMPTVSAPNWASMIMGAGPEQHGVTSNDWRKDTFDIAPTVIGPGGFFPTVFSVLREQRKDAAIGIFHHWGGFAVLVEPGVANVVEHCKTQGETISHAVAYLKENKPTLLFIHLDHVDDAGHKYGHGSPEYIAAVAETDRLTARVLDAVRAAGIENDTLVLLTADHGGVGKKHGGNSMAELEIPWIVRGPGVREGHEIESPVNTYDTAATIAAVLSLRPPAAWIARPVREAFAQ